MLINGDTLLDSRTRSAVPASTRRRSSPAAGGAISDSNVVEATIGPARNPAGDDSQIEAKAQIVALIATVAIFLLILDLVRRRACRALRAAVDARRAGVAGAGDWTDGLNVIADLIGIQEPANAIFISPSASSACVLHFSVAISRLSEEIKSCQESARLEHELG